jgi:hypothetical protein
MERDTLHSVGSLGECLDDKLPVLLAPSPHLWVRINNGIDIIHDIFLLSTLDMEGYAERCQRLKGGLYVDLGSTRDTYVEVWDAQANKILDKTEDLFSWGWHARIVGTLVECIHDEVNGALIRK